MASRVDLPGLYSAVDRIRVQNQKIATDNMVLKSELQLVNARRENLIAESTKQREDLQLAATREALEIANEVKARSVERNQRKKVLNAEIKAMKLANERLEIENRILGGDLVKMKKIHESFPSAARQKPAPKKK
jgi:hypothetical protein